MMANRIIVTVGEPLEGYSLEDWISGFTKKIGNNGVVKRSKKSSNRLAVDASPYVLSKVADAIKNDLEQKMFSSFRAEYHGGRVIREW